MSDTKEKSETKEKSDGQDATLRATIRVVAGTALVATVASMFAGGFRFGIGVLSGGIIAVVNLIVLARIVQAFLTRKGNTAPWAIIAVLKLGFLLGGIYLLMKSGMVSGLALVIGYMSLPVGAVIASVFGPKPPEAD